MIGSFTTDARQAQPAHSTTRNMISRRWLPQHGLQNMVFGTEVRLLGVAAERSASFMVRRRQQRGATLWRLGLKWYRVSYYKQNKKLILF